MPRTIVSSSRLVVAITVTIAASCQTKAGPAQDDAGWPSGGRGNAGNPMGGMAASGATGSGALGPGGRSPGGQGSGVGGVGSGGGGEAGGLGVGGLGVGGLGEDGGTGGLADPGVDAFGIRHIYPSHLPEALFEAVHFSSEGPYSLTERRDPRDSSGLSGMRGDGQLTVNTYGELIMSGSEPRMYIYDDPIHPWQNVEVTVYYQRVSDEAASYAGLVVGVRSGAEGHNSGDLACDAHTYYARLRHDGAADFEKELQHPGSTTRSRVEPNTVWPGTGELPFGAWVGWKFVVYNRDDEVVLEAYRDLTNGSQGGEFELLNETRDAGDWAAPSDCATHFPVAGQSELVVAEGGVVLLRNTRVTEARYKWISVREIEPPLPR